MQPALLIHGPTASGKTQISIEMAKSLNGEVINADSMQVYRDLHVITARPTTEEMEQIPHHLFGYKDAAERGSAGSWLRDVTPVIRDIQKRGKTPIVIGGTGLHLQALIEGLSEIPAIADHYRQEARQMLQQDGNEAALDYLKSIDPVTGERLTVNDRQRVARAIEVYLATGKPLSHFHKNKTKPILGAGEWLGVALTPPRVELYARIDRRFAAMMMEGAMEEARALADRDLDPTLPAMKAHGMPWLIAYLKGEMSSELAVEYAKRDTRRYAKRQFTWISHQFPFWPRIPSQRVENRKRVINALFKEIDAGVLKR